MASLIDSFPLWGLVPKKETGITSFLTKNPDYNGKDVTIAIFDSGVDPGAPGLQKTPDGKVKVVERFDCSGCGDVNMSTVVQSKESIITGISGRKLKIPSNWTNPTNNYRIGIKNSFDLYPEKLRERIQDETKEKHWDNQHKLVLAEASRNLVSFESKFTNGNTITTEEDKLKKENYEAMLEHLVTLDKKYSDVGTFYDCVMFHDGDKWMACVDTSEQGDLEKGVLLGEYSITHEFAKLSEDDQLNFSINVHDNGNVLELVGLCSSHGTHVASITSAYFPDDPDKCGVAPGAQIVSLTIGDGRLGSMETGTALVRAMIKIMELKKTIGIDLINMSYGEHTHWSNAGRIGELMNEVVNKYGVIFVASAGNHGPALNTIGTPPDISQDVIIGVGAYVSPDMMVAEYAMRTKLPGMPYTWTSRGPTIDGGIGVTVCAPGGAITSVPNFTLRNSQLMNGTSMSSPHVAGAVGVILSGLKQNNKTYSPYQIKRALENGATLLPNIDTFSQGNGLLNVEKSFEILMNHSNCTERDVRFHISCGLNNQKGIYIRNKLHKENPECSVIVDPFFIDTDTVPASKKIDFNLKLGLVCKASYVHHPRHLDISNMQRVFGVKIETDGLIGVNTTFIEAYDVECVEKGAVFRIPITIIKPVTVIAPNYSINEAKVYFEANTIKRKFINVPDFATWAVIRMRSSDVVSLGKFVVHCMQILPKQSCKTLELNRIITVTSNAESVLSFPVRGSLTLEVVIAKYWANIGEAVVDYSISFYGIKPNQSAITMLAADGIHALEVTSLQGEEIMPSISLKNSVQILRPSESKVNPLTARDIIPPGRQIYELALTYSFHINKATEVSPNCSILSNVLYESEFESQFWMLYDSNKQYLGCGDAYPSKYSVKLEKGDYTLKLQIRHDKKEYLDKMTETTILLNQKLSTAIPLEVYSNFSHAVTNGKKAVLGHSLYSSTIPLYIAPLAADKYVVKNHNAAHYLTGTITYAKDELGKKADVYSIKYILNESNRTKPTKTPEKGKTKNEEYKDALRELKTTWLSKLDAANGSETLYQEMLKEFTDYLPSHTAYMQTLEVMDAKHQLPLLTQDEINNQNKEDIKKIVEICDKVLDNINQESILAHIAIKNDQRSDAAQIKQVMDRQKTVLIDCLCRKGIALCRLKMMNEDDVSMESIGKIWKNLLQLGDPNDSKETTDSVEPRWNYSIVDCFPRTLRRRMKLSPFFKDERLTFPLRSFTLNIILFGTWHAATLKQYGRLLKYLHRMNEEKATKEVDDKILEIYSQFDWIHLVCYMEKQLLAKYPSNYKPF